MTKFKAADANNNPATDQSFNAKVGGFESHAGYLCFNQHLLNNRLVSMVYNIRFFNDVFIPQRIFSFVCKIQLTSLCLCVCQFSVEAADISNVPRVEQTRIADLIFKNECNRKFSCLVSWNDGEEFASLGIGHFIWFPQGSKAPFQESFPDLLVWFRAHHVTLPTFLVKNMSSCPWQSKKDFLEPDQQKNIQILRQFLFDHQEEQAAFIINRLEQALPKLLDTVSNQQQQNHIQKQFKRLSDSPLGWYALTDYVNFKGEGTKPSERYHGKGWGLLQVLLHMQGEQKGISALRSFVSSANFILQRRVLNSPHQRNEKRWLIGWKKRLNTYLNVK